MSRFRFLCLALLTSLALLAPRLAAAPVLLNVDASFEGLGTAAQLPLATGVIEVGWLDAGTTFAQIQGFFAAQDLASVRAAFNTVSTVTNLNSFGDGLPFESLTVVADGDAPGLAAYKNPLTGPAGKMAVAWIRNNASEASATEHAFAFFPVNFAAANDVIGFTDFNTDVGTASDVLPAGNMAFGAIVNVISGSGIDTNGGSPVDGKGLYDGTKVLVTAPVSSTATIAFSAATYSVSESGGMATITVNRSGATSSMVTAQYTTNNGSALAGTDYTTTSGTVTFIANDTSEQILVPVADRAGFQGDRNFTITLSSPGAGAELGSPSMATVTITDDETAMPGQLVLSSATYSVAENGTQVAITVQRVGGTDGAVSATLASTDGSATAGQDFTAVNQSVMFAAGDAVAKVINVAITNDAMFEGNETFTVALSAPQGGATIGAPGSATVTINEDDAPPGNGALSFTSATYNVAEDGGTVTITVQRTLGSSGTVGVTYGTTNGSAIAGTDYTNTSGMLSWASEDTANKTFTVPITDNINDEADKTFQVVLSAPTGGAALAAPSSSTVTINDDDIAGTLAWSAAASNVNENAGNAVLTITRTGGTDGAVAVTVNTSNGTATAGTDYTAVTNATANFANGQASAMVNVPITDNGTFQGNRDFTVTLSAPTNGAVLGAPATQTVTIVEDEVAMPGALAFSAANYTVDEASGTATITVVRSGGSDTTVMVTFAATAGTANAGDFTETMGTLTFVAGDLSESFTVTINNDTMAEPNETVNLALSNPTNGATLGTPNTATLTIVSEDAPPSFRLSAANYAGTEGTTVSVIVQRVGGLDQTLTVNYATQNGTALSGSDYKKATGTLTFGPNETEMTVPVELKLDTVAESAEKFKFVLSAPSQGATLGEPNKATITIARNGAIDQPDNAVATEPFHRFAGKDVYNTTGNGQTASKTIKPGGKAEFTLRVANNGNLTDSLKVVATPSGTANGARTRIFYRGNEVTARITSPDGFTVNNLGRKAAVEFEVLVKFNGGLANTGYGATFTTTSVNTPAAIDVARVVAIIRD